MQINPTIINILGIQSDVEPAYSQVRLYTQVESKLSLEAGKEADSSRTGRKRQDWWETEAQSWLTREHGLYRVKTEYAHLQINQSAHWQQLSSNYLQNLHMLFLAANNILSPVQHSHFLLQSSCCDIWSLEEEAIGGNC